MEVLGAWVLVAALGVVTAVDPCPVGFAGSSCSIPCESRCFHGFTSQTTCHRNGSGLCDCSLPFTGILCESVVNLTRPMPRPSPDTFFPFPGLIIFFSTVIAILAGALFAAKKYRSQNDSDLTFNSNEGVFGTFRKGSHRLSSSKHTLPSEAFAIRPSLQRASISPNPGILRRPTRDIHTNSTETEASDTEVPCHLTASRYLRPFSNTTSQGSSSSSAGLPTATPPSPTLPRKGVRPLQLSTSASLQKHKLEALMQEGIHDTESVDGDGRGSDEGQSSHASSESCTGFESHKLPPSTASSLPLSPDESAAGVLAVCAGVAYLSTIMAGLVLTPRRKKRSSNLREWLAHPAPPGCAHALSQTDHKTFAAWLVNKAGLPQSAVDMIPTGLREWEKILRDPPDAEDCGVMCDGETLRNLTESGDTLPAFVVSPPPSFFSARCIAAVAALAVLAATAEPQ